MPRENIGTIDCPCCGDEASVREQGKSKRAYIMCDACGFQGFARFHTSDAHLRKKMRPVMRHNEPIDDEPAPKKNESWGTLI